jgi:hypothetical protein
MRPLLGIAAALGVFALAGSAQEAPDKVKVEQKKAAMKMQVDQIDQMLKGAQIVKFEAGIMGPAVKGAPYSADEIHETTQVLADGTRIHNETKTTVSRDSQGRIRRESPGEVMIWDSAAGTSYVLNQSDQTAHKMQMAVNYSFIKKSGGATDGPPQVTSFHFPDGAMPPVANEHTIVIRNMDGGVAAAGGKMQFQTFFNKDVKKETLGNQILEGVTCEGTRLTSTIEAGAIGNDRPIQSTEDRWYSPDLQVNFLVKKTDPRTGEDTVRLTNVRRLEPDPSLFTVPQTYQIK